MFIELILLTQLAGCPQDCSKVLVAQERRKTPKVQTQTYKHHPVPKDLKARGCVDMNDGQGCKPIDITSEKSPFYTIITSEDL